MPPGRVILRDDDAAVLRDRAADGIARLQHALDDTRFEQIDLAQSAVTPEDVSVAAIARIDHRGVREVAEAADARIDIRRLVSTRLICPLRALDDHPEVAGAAQVGAAQAASRIIDSRVSNFFMFITPEAPLALRCFPPRSARALLDDHCPRSTPAYFFLDGALALHILPGISRLAW
jgi:hypothetical protein